VLKLGCFGCLSLFILTTVLGVFGWGVFQLTRAPEIVGSPTSPVDGLRAQQKIFDALRRAGSGRPHTVALSEQEVNAFLERHLEHAGDLPLRHLVVRLPSDAHAEIAGQIPFRYFTNVAPFSALAGLVPAAWLDRGAWLSLRARVTLDHREGGRGRRHLRLDVQRFWLGRLRLPEVMLKVLLDPVALQLLRWPVPEAIDGLRIEPGRLVIQSAS
jgi:hypothetical protein